MLLKMALFHFLNGCIIFYCIFVQHLDSFVSEHLDCFHILAVGNSAVENTGVYISLWTCFSLDMCPEVGLLDHMVAQSLVSWETSLTVLLSRYANLHSHNCRGGLPFFHILTSIYCLQTWIMAILIGVRWCLTVVLICISLIISNVEHLFLCLLASVCLLWRNVCLGLLPFFWLGCLFSWYWATWAVANFGD